MGFNNIDTIEEFASAVSSEIKNYLPEEYSAADISVKEIIKANDTRRLSINIKLPDEDTVPTVYMEEYYERFKAGESFESIVQDAADSRVMYAVREKQGDKIKDVLMDFEKAKNNLVIELGSTEWNKERISSCVNRQVGEFTETYRVAFDSEMGQGSVKVDEALRNFWGKSEEEIHDAAVFASELRNPTLCTMEDMLFHSFGGSVTNLFESPEAGLGREIPMLILTTEDKIYGSALMLREDILSKAASILDDSFYILPSSIHEVLLIPESAGMDPEELEHMVRSVNEAEVLPEERLSDHVHFYDQEMRMLRNMHDGSFITKDKLDRLDSGKRMIARYLVDKWTSDGDMNNPAKKPKKRSR